MWKEGNGQTMDSANQTNNDEQVINNRLRTTYVAEQLEYQLKDEFNCKDFTDALLDNLAMLFILRKKFFSYIEYLKNVHVRHEYDERLDEQGTAQSFVHESVLHSAILFACITIGKNDGDFGSIKKFALKGWADEQWRNSLEPSDVDKEVIGRLFHLRDKLIGHIDIDLDQIITEEDIKKLIDLYDGFVVKSVERIFEKFLGHNQNGSLDFEDISVQTYALLHPRGTLKRYASE
jgi:hypothetical protein